METEREDATRAEKTTNQEEVGDRCEAPEDPSAERLDDGACDGIGEGGEDGRESAGRSRRGQRKRRAVIVAAGVLIILGFGAGAWILSEAASVGEEAAGPDGAKDASEETVAVAFSVEADGWTEGSSPFLAHITGETGDGDAVDFWHAVWPDGTGSVVELPAGTYRISWTSAINADGSIYRVPGEPGELTVGAGDTEIGGSFEQVPAGDVTQDDLDQILGEIGEAVGNGDETLSGDAGQGVIDSATENAGNNPNADKEEIEQAGEEASGNVSEEPQTPSGTGNSGSSSGSGSGSGSTGGSSSSSGSTGGGSTSGSGSGSSSSHTHNWVAQTEQQWVQDSAAYDEQVWVEDSAAWTETVQTGSHIECSCGQTFSNTTEWNAHNKAQGAGNQHSYSVVPTYETIYHEATGHYETVHHDATGHYETVTTGYKCSSCGATK